LALQDPAHLSLRVQHALRVQHGVFFEGDFQLLAAPFGDCLRSGGRTGVCAIKSVERNRGAMRLRIIW
jgi:hypothetical protein